MKLRDLAKGTRAVKQVSFRLANAPEPKVIELDEPVAPDEYTAKLCVRVLTGAEFAEAISRAQADALSKGVKEWLDTHPLCRLYEMVHTLAVACVDADCVAEPFFASADEILKSPEVGEDNIAYLYAKHRAWQDECSPFVKDFTLEQVIGLLALEAERPENSDSPLDRMPPVLLKSFIRTTASLFANSLNARLGSGSSGDASTNSTSKSDPGEA